MKTVSYNPSPIEVALAKSIASLKNELAARIDGIKIQHIKEDLNADNPILRFYIMDEDGDRHEVALRIIQKPDEHLI